MRALKDSTAPFKYFSNNLIRLVDKMANIKYYRES